MTFTKNRVKYQSCRISVFLIRQSRDPDFFDFFPSACETMYNSLDLCNIKNALLLLMLAEFSRRVQLFGTQSTMIQIVAFILFFRHLFGTYATNKCADMLCLSNSRHPHLSWLILTILVWVFVCIARFSAHCLVSRFGEDQDCFRMEIRSRRQNAMAVWVFESTVT